MYLSELREYKPDIISIASKYGAEDIRVFGSTATNSAHNGSDIDFLVKLKPGTSLFDLGGLYVELKDLLGCEVDIVTEGAISKYLKDDILKSALKL